LSDVTHVVVDEVHERTILSDFLLIVLKNLVEKRSNEQGRKLKVILMSATVDSSLFARYFGECPVISVEGRTHPVSTHFLEDVYEKMEYCLELDSPASGAYFAQHGEKVLFSEFSHLILIVSTFFICWSPVTITVSFVWLELVYISLAHCICRYRLVLLVFCV